MFKDRLIDFNLHLHAEGLTKEATALAPGIFQYATELGIDSSSSSSDKGSKTELIQGVKSAIAKAGNDTPLGVARLLRRMMVNAGIYGWLGDTSKCFISLGNPDDPSSVNWFFDLNNGNYVGRYHIASEDKWSKMLQHYGKWLQQAQKSFAILNQDGENKGAIKQLDSVRQNLVKFQPMIADIVKNCASDIGAVDFESKSDFSTDDITSLQEAVKYAIDVLPKAIKHYRQRSTWVKVAQQETKHVNQRQLKQYRQKLLSVVEQHNPETSPLAFCWAVARNYISFKLFPTQYIDTERVVLSVGKQDAVFVFELQNGHLLKTLPFDAGDAYIRKRQKELAAKRKKEDEQAEDEALGYDKDPDRKQQDKFDRMQRLKEEQQREVQEETKARKRIRKRNRERERKRKTLRLIEERNKERKENRQRSRRHKRHYR